MNTLEELKIKRFKIIEPFLKKEKKLKDIESETGISYATLKRWIKSYKESGLLGLEKKEREDKNSFKVIDQEGISIIKDLCSKENESNISKLYENCKNSLKEKDYNISYPTFYRILNNLDGFFKKSVSFHLNKIKKSNEIFSVIEMPLSIFVQSTKVVVPSILLLFDLSDLKIIHCTLNTDPTNIYSILGFIKEALLKLSILENKLIKPKEILIDSKNTISKSISKEIFNKTNIKISNYTSYDEEIKKFINLLNEDLNKSFFNKDKIFSKKIIEDFLDTYIYLDNPNYNFKPEFDIIKNSKFIKEFDVLLQSTTRKVSSSSFRFKNIIFKSNILSSLEGQQIELKFNPLDHEKIYIFFKDQFYDLITI